MNEAVSRTRMGDGHIFGVQGQYSSFMAAQWLRRRCHFSLGEEEHEIRYLALAARRTAVRSTNHDSTVPFLSE